MAARVMQGAFVFVMFSVVGAQSMVPRNASGAVLLTSRRMRAASLVQTTLDKSASGKGSSELKPVTVCTAENWWELADGNVRAITDFLFDTVVTVGGSLLWKGAKMLVNLIDSAFKMASLFSGANNLASKAITETLGLDDTDQVFKTTFFCYALYLRDYGDNCYYPAGHDCYKEQQQQRLRQQYRVALKAREDDRLAKQTQQMQQSRQEALRQKVKERAGNQTNVSNIKLTKDQTAYVNEIKRVQRSQKGSQPKRTKFFGESL